MYGSLSIEKKMNFKDIFILLALISLASTLPLEPGQPGGPWTSEEIDIVRDKVSNKVRLRIFNLFDWIYFVTRSVFEHSNILV